MVSDETDEAYVGSNPTETNGELSKKAVRRE